MPSPSHSSQFLSPKLSKSFIFLNVIHIDIDIKHGTFSSGARGGAIGSGTALHCAKSRKNAGSIPSGRTMALGLTQPLTEMSTRSISWG